MTLPDADFTAEFLEEGRDRVANAACRGVEALRRLDETLAPSVRSTAAVGGELLRAYRRLQAWADVVRFVEQWREIAPEEAAVRTVVQQYAMALNRSGQGKVAERVLVELRDSGGLGGEGFGLLGRIYKERFQDARKLAKPRTTRVHLRNAIKAYTDGFEADPRAFYPGINAATLLGFETVRAAREQQHSLIARVRTAIENTPDSVRGYWEHATLLELAVLEDHEERALDCLRQALRANGDAWMLETTAANLKLIADGREEGGEAPTAVAWVRSVRRALLRRGVGMQTGLPRHVVVDITLPTRTNLCVRMLGANDWAFNPLNPLDDPKLAQRVSDEIVGAKTPAAAARALRGIGATVHGLLTGAGLDVLALVGDSGDDATRFPLVFELDVDTVEYPWELAFDGESFLCRHAAVSRRVWLADPKVLDRPMRSSGELRALVIGNPTGDLPYASREAARVADILDKSGVALDDPLVDHVTYADISRALDNGPYDIVHYAGHSIAEAERGTYGIVLATRQGGTELLKPNDLAHRAPLPAIVVANSCESAETSTHELPSRRARGDFVSALVREGVECYVGCVWPVRDAAAAAFAGAFYKALLPDGCAIGEAVRRARCAVVDECGEGDSSWASYVLYGSPWKHAMAG